MCGCTLYDSPTCGHSWVSMSQPCGYLSDLLNCPYRQTYQTLIAPAYTCPTCNGGFADCETIEMVQGPWGCNQLIRGHVGGSHAIPGQWGNVQLHSMTMPTTMSNAMAGPAITCGPLVRTTGHQYDHRITGPHTPPAPMIYNSYMYGGRRKHSRSSYHKYKYSSRPATNCVVM